MADVDFSPANAGGTTLITWEELTSTNTAGTQWEPLARQGLGVTVQFLGTFDSAIAALQGSNDGTNWLTVKDTLGSDVSFTTAGYAEVSTGFRYLRPSTSGGSGSQDIDCILAARG